MPPPRKRSFVETASNNSPPITPHRPSRRDFLCTVALAAPSAALPPRSVFAQIATQHPAPAAPPRFPSADPRWQAAWEAALAVLAGNVKPVPGFDHPVLLEGAVYPGVWQECGPLEALAYANLRQFVAPAAGASSPPSPLAVARANHMAFFALQHQDGQIPSAIKVSGSVGFGQIQMVVPIAATAWELVQLTHDEALLTAAYTACSRWDAWLRRYRNTRGTGLVEGFCTYDTGMDNSPRWAGIPNRCPDADARKCPPIPSMPRLCPDLSATVYGARIALAAMARALGKSSEAARWDHDAETLRRLILTRLYSPEDASFYDLDAQNNFVKVRSVANTRVLGEHVLQLDHAPNQAPDRRIFDALWSRQLHNPAAFWPAFPFPSVALDDPLFVRPIPRNSWGGASQALTALRAPRWMSHYGKHAELRTLMLAWATAIRDSGGFRQQMNPLTGAFTLADASGYSPTALVYLDFVRRLAEA
jgi:hypothetical protein